jgi:chemosensory pili system protein ChpA (sensor histidine kinase/response regulator)
MPKVLIVEDETTQRELYATLLRHFGYQVLEASDGVEAVVLAKEHQPDVILLDIYMPRLDGFGTAAILREEESLRHIPILGISAVIHDEHDERLEAAGIDRFYSKSSDHDRLYELLVELVGPPAA